MMLAKGRTRPQKGSRGAAGQTGTGAATRFEVQGRAGEGTLWIVYRVRERDTGQVRALKALKGAFNRHDRFVELLGHGLNSMVSLENDGLAALYEVGQEEGTLYLVTDWLPGGSLENSLSRGPSQAAIRDEVLHDISQGLAYLHERGLTHGDVRPRQILADESGQWKLTDAAQASALAGAGMATADVQPEAAYYLAPERTQGSPLSPATDMYALGVVLYRMITGRPPFDGPSPLSIALRHRNDAPLPPGQINERCSAPLEALTLALLSKNPESRPTAVQVLEAMRADGFAVPSGPRKIGAAAAQAVPVSPQPAEEEDDAPAPPAARGRRRTLPAVQSQPLSPEQVKDLQRKRGKGELLGALWAFAGLLISLAVFAGLFVGAYWYWVNESPREVMVPKYVGLSEEGARRSLAAKDLTLRIGKEIYDPKQPAGTVVAGDPPPGKRVRANREVVVTVSQGQKPITMPNFREMSLAQARKIVNLTGMRLGPVNEQYHEKVPAGYICGQYPDAGQLVRRSDPINIIVSRGPQMVGSDGSSIPGISSPVSPTSGGSSSDIIDSAPGTDQESPDGTSISRTVRIRVAVPSDGPERRVQIIVLDSDGERTVYSRTRKPGEVVSERVKITRAQGSTATIRVYVGSDLIKEQSI